MTWNAVAEQAKVAADLRAIVDMCGRLREQAEHDALRGDVGNSEAMMALGAVGNTEAANWRLAAAEDAHLEGRAPEATYVLDWTDDNDQPPLLVLATWEDLVREERDEPTYMKASIEHAAGYLRDRLDWAFGTDEYGDANWLGVDELARDLRKLKARLESILSEGIRAEMGVPCMYDGKRIRRHIDHKGERSDWFCPSCHRTWKPDDYSRRVTAAAEAAKQEDIDGVTWCSEDYAARDTARPVKTIRTWVQRGLVTRVCIIAGRRERFVNLDEVRAADKAARERGRLVA